MSYQRRLEASRRWKARNKEHIRQYNQSRKAIKTKWMREKRRNDPEFRKLESKRHGVYHQKRIKSDTNYLLRHVLRSRINSAICRSKGIKRFDHINNLIGAPIEIVRKYIENQFKKGMNWGNHGLHGWHVDHVKPVATFDLTDEKAQKECFHYTNLRPLWAKENLDRRKAKV